jgi:hypothetical protein
VIHKILYHYILHSDKYSTVECITREILLCSSPTCIARCWSLTHSRTAVSFLHLFYASHLNFYLIDLFWSFPLEGTNVFWFIEINRETASIVLSIQVTDSILDCWISSFLPSWRKDWGHRKHNAQSNQCMVG